LKILDQKSSDEDMHRRAIKILEEGGSINYAKDRARLIMRQAW
jgi:hypothetical protein